MKYNNILEQLILGSMLGDGYITKQPKNIYNSRLSIAHSKKQYKYIKFKHNILNKNNLARKLCYNKIYNKRYKKGYFTEYRFKSAANNYFTIYRKLFYINNVKYLNFEELEKLNWLGLSIWFIDDGNKCTRSYQLNTQNFTLSEIKNIQKLLMKKFNIYTTYDKNKVIYIRTISKEIFENLIFKLTYKYAKNKLHGSCINRMNCKKAKSQLAAKSCRKGKVQRLLGYIRLYSNTS